MSDTATAIPPQHARSGFSCRPGWGAWTFVLAMAIGLLAGSAARAQTTLRANRIATGLTGPLCIAHAPGDSSRLFILERTGKIKILNLAGNTINGTPFLDVGPLIATAWLEYGLLGIAFHPDFQNNGFFYVNYTPLPASGNVADTLVTRYHVPAGTPNLADPASATPILRFGFGTRLQHRAGWMDFGPDGYLYISTGDGAESDPDNAAQNTTLLRGKILRIDVNGPDGIPGTSDDDGFPADANKNYRIPPSNPFAGSLTNAQEIWAYGLRNPWRCSFDRVTGDLWIGDVGQNTREEVDFIPAGSAGGRNFGWRCTEGTFCPGLTGCTCNGPTLTPPVYEYPHTVGLSVTGGYVYRGCAIPDLRGTYIFADYQNSKVFSLRYNGTTVSNFTDRTTEVGAVGLPAALGEDNDGELYIADNSGGGIYKLVARITPPAALTITQQPASVSACPSQTANFTVAATSVGSTAGYQWQLETAPGVWINTNNGALPYNGGTIFAAGATTSQLQLSLSVLPGAPAIRFRCIVTNACATGTSNPATLSFYQPCSIADICGIGGPSAVPCGDGLVTGDDFNAFISAFAAGDALADITGIGGPPEPRDGLVTGDDFNAFISAFVGGCH